MNNFIVYYNNGILEAHKKMDASYLHLIEIGVVKFVADVEDGKVWTRGEDGISTKINITQVSMP